MRTNWVESFSTLRFYAFKRCLIALFVLPVSAGTRTVSTTATAPAGGVLGAGTAGGLPAENQVSAADNIQNRRGANDNNNNRF